jgi:phosphoribosylamine--glycine ligase
MRVLVIGSGGREHAISYFLSESSLIDRLFWTPGNAGADDIAENPGIPGDDFIALLQFAKREKIDLTVVGPEAPLVNGLSDLFTENDLVIFGPGSEGAKIEGSKIYAKQLMKEKGIPTAGFADFYDMHSATQYIEKLSPPYVIKADGLAGGKGVIIATDV